MQSSTVSRREKINPGGIGELANLVKVWFASVSDDRLVRIPLSDGSVLQGVLHPGWSLEEARDLVGRTADMSHAYK